MKILGIDTSTKFLGAAIIDERGVLAGYQDEGDLKHYATLVPTIDRLLKKCHLKLKNIDAIALSIGPGSFTGLRIGVATCKGINMALGIPIVAIPTLDVIAENFSDEKNYMLCPLLDAKKKKVYACLFDGKRGLKRLTDYMLLDVASLLKKIKNPTLIFGDAVGLYKDSLEKNSYVNVSTKSWYPRAEIVARLGLAKARKRKFTNPDRLAPMYLHSKYCQVKK
ncbi:MAG: tRNA (adenosine(37)-N6)-threonylcarbamoyltransferase complex dimerization subunit type 1 TsaB [Candidatus Omnitrophica bacterium]|nr:tRNA (adenosine(37)-N6)-threonylcarbamoyltransferase complex dimerization subunit type 1 TsaB [Candidatus Omnitrophota bacterium]